MNDYSFSNFKDFFEYNLKKNTRRQDGSKRLTLSELSQKLGYKSPSLLSMMANGKRLPSGQILEILFEEWEIDNNQREIIRIRVEIEKRIKKDKPTLKLIEKLSHIDKKSNYQIIDLDNFNAISNWHNLILKMLISTPDFQEDPLLISQILKKKVTTAQIKKGIKTLLEARLIKRNEKTGKLEDNTANLNAETTHDIPSEAIREHHRGMITRALESIDEQTIEKRHLNALTLKFDRNKTNEAKDFILNFVKEFNEKFYDKNSRDINQLNVQFFEHTEYPKIKDSHL